MQLGKLLAIDGLNIVRRVYEAGPEEDSADKAAIALGHALSSFRKLLATHQPSHVLAAFDFGGHTWRHDAYPAYRQHRAPMPVVSVPGVEADDVIATAVGRWLGDGRGEAIIASNDKDLHVLIAHGALVWDYFKGEWHDSAWVERKFGVPPAMLADLLALAGDAADGVPGVSKVGTKTAAKLLLAYKDLEGVMAGAGILKSTLGERLRKERDLLAVSRQLVALKMDVTLGVTWNTLVFSQAGA